MTDRVKGITIVLDRDIRTDDVEVLVNAIRLLRGVATVDTVLTTSDDYFARERIRTELVGKMFDVLKKPE